MLYIASWRSSVDGDSLEIHLGTELSGVNIFYFINSPFGFSSTSPKKKDRPDSDSNWGFQELSNKVALQTETAAFTIPSDAQNRWTPDVLTTTLSELSLFVSLLVPCFCI